MTQRTVTVSVRRLVEFILRTGDIDRAAGSLAEMDAMQQGSRMHRKLQKDAGPSYKAEVSMKHTTVIDASLSVTVEGRADGVITESEMAADETGVLSMRDVVTIDEIKGTFSDIRYITEPVPVHMAQAMCYAYFYALQENLTDIQVQMTYVNLETGRVRRFVEKKAREELAVWYRELIEKFATWAKWQIAWVETRNLSIQACSFPFSYRDSQRKLVSGIYQTIVRRRRLFVEAPTGTGKTIAAIYPSVQAVGAGLGEKIFYLTAKTIARTVAESTFSILQDKGLAMKVITLTARDKICIFDEAVCNPDFCPRAKGHYDRVNEAVFDLINHEERINRECLAEYAERYNVCPFEMQLDAALWVDAVICDYNYVFDPDIALKRFFSERSGDYLFLIDEAHNLVERAREMYSAVLQLDDLKKAARGLKGINRKLSERLSKCIRAMDAFKDASGAEWELLGNIGALLVHLNKLMESMTELLKKDLKSDQRELMTDLFFTVRRFINTFDRSDDRYLTYGLRQEQSFSIKIFCVEPSKDIGEHLAVGRSAVFFSATLLPVQYYKEMLSDTADEDYDLYVDSPFDPANCLLVAADDVSTKYSRRGQKEYERIAEYIRYIIRGKHGNYMIFFPSYQLMKDVFDIFTEMELVKAGHGLHIVMQEAAMDEGKRQAFLDEFQACPTKSVIGFCVMGGIFSEGIDLKEDRLIGAIIVGTGLPQVGCERELLNQYFNEKCGRGFDYAYLYPGMNKVLQAGGRVIRTENDKGVIALLDERFNYQQYRRIFPREWQNCSRTKLSTISQCIEQFWTEKTLI